MKPRFKKIRGFQWERENEYNYHAAAQYFDNGYGIEIRGIFNIRTDYTGWYYNIGVLRGIPATGNIEMIFVFEELTYEEAVERIERIKAGEPATKNNYDFYPMFEELVKQGRTKYVQMNRGNYWLLHLIYGDAANDKTATFQLPEHINFGYGIIPIPPRAYREKGSFVEQCKQRRNHDTETRI